MFSESDGYERFMGRWSRRLAPLFVTFAGVTEGDRVLDVGSGTGALSAAAAAVALDPDAAARDERHMPLCTPGSLAQLWRTHGLHDVDEQPLTIDMPFTSFDDYWQPFLCGQGPAGRYTSSLTESARNALESTLRADVGLTMRARAWAVRGVVT
jgi:hypothetical protein